MKTRPAVDDARKRSCQRMDGECDKMEARIAELEAQLRQEQEAHAGSCQNWRSVADDLNAQVAQLQTTISQLDAAAKLLKKMRFEMIQAGWNKWVRELDAIFPRSAALTNITP